MKSAAHPASPSPGSPRGAKGTPTRVRGQSGALALAYESDELAEKRAQRSERDSLEPESVSSASVETEVSRI